ncbi:CPm [Cordyline virus 1]|uniref:CPm n=1 Tax=Cordyline virus 1 TaxID=937809 RepID=E7CT69_9CLOS|nr:CPm [Cordyline virus 1]ADU03661.1 CPm [Cordyline virus 1]
MNVSLKAIGFQYSTSFSKSVVVELDRNILVKALGPNNIFAFVIGDIQGYIRIRIYADGSLLKYSCSVKYGNKIYEEIDNSIIYAYNDKLILDNSKLALSLNYYAGRYSFFINNQQALLCANPNWKYNVECYYIRVVNDNVAMVDEKLQRARFTWELNLSCYVDGSLKNGVKIITSTLYDMLTYEYISDEEYFEMIYNLKPLITEKAECYTNSSSLRSDANGVFRAYNIWTRPLTNNFIMIVNNGHVKIDSLNVITQIWLGQPNVIVYEIVLRQTKSGSKIEFWTQTQTDHVQSRGLLINENILPKISNKCVLGFFFDKNRIFFTVNLIVVAEIENKLTSGNVQFGNELQFLNNTVSENQKFSLKPLKEFGKISHISNDQVEAIRVRKLADDNSKVVIAMATQAKPEHFEFGESKHVSDFFVVENKTVPDNIVKIQEPIIEKSIESIKNKDGLKITIDDKFKHLYEESIVGIVDMFKTSHETAKMICYQIGITFGSTKELVLLKDQWVSMTIENKTLEVNVAAVIEKFYNGRGFRFNYFRLFLRKNSLEILNLLRDGKLVPNQKFSIKYGIDEIYSYLACDFWDYAMQVTELEKGQLKRILNYENRRRL